MLNRIHRVLAGVPLLFLYSWLLAGQAKATVTEASENELRAAVIHGILKYTHWKYEVTGRVCILGNAPSAATLARTARHLRINQHPVEVKFLGDQINLQACDALVIGSLSASENGQLSQHLDTIPLLSICDQCDHATLDTNIRLKVVRDRIRFDIVMGLNDHTYVDYRSQLLEMASSISPSHPVR